MTMSPGLRKLAPDTVIIAEEEMAAGRIPTLRDGQPFWLVDPLDGTVNFAHGLPFFSVSLGCVIDGEVRAGVVHAPALGMTFAARRGAGSSTSPAPSCGSWWPACCCRGCGSWRDGCWCVHHGHGHGYGSGACLDDANFAVGLGDFEFRDVGLRDEVDQGFQFAQVHVCDLQRSSRARGPG